MREYSRREALKTLGLTVGVVGAATLGIGGCATSGDNSVYLADASGRVLTSTGQKRHFPPYYGIPFVGDGTFDNHVKVYKLAGIDYNPISREEDTEIVPIARGIVIGRGHEPLAGYFVKLYHGNGFITLYAHMKEPTPVKLGSQINRNMPIGLMGNTGQSKGKIHLHISLYGAEKLKTDKVQPNENPEGVFSKTVYDPEEFSVLGKHKRLPYQLSEEVELDDRFQTVIKRARQEVDDFVRAYPVLDKKRPPTRILWMKKHVVDPREYTLDYEIGDIIDETSKAKTPIPKGDAAFMNERARKMLIDTRDNFKATAPIKDPKSSGLYTYSR